MSRFERWFGGTTNDSPRASARGSDPRLVERSNIAVWVTRGWKRFADNRYDGVYASKWGTVHGSIQKRADTWTVSIQNPPPEMQYNPKWSCFHPQSKKDGWYWIHLAQPPRDPSDDVCVSSIIVYVERLLSESYRYSPGKR